MAKRKRARNTGENPTLEMTPMIDVVFQLLIFFIVTMKQEDILARLLANRPAPSKPPDNPPDDVFDFLDIEISQHAVLFMRNSLGADLTRPIRGGDIPVYNFAPLDRLLGEQARFGTTATVTIRCTLNSSHGVLMEVLDLLAKHGFKNLNIFSI